ncbi:MAG TPA: SpoIIE family protein phosphatase [Thermoleophilaceae bacterium]
MAHTRVDARRNRTAIVGAAATEVALRGELSMANVAAAAGLSRSTLHRHFPRRSDLQEALRKEASEEVRAALASADEDGGAPMAVLRRVVSDLVDIGARRRPELLGPLALRDRSTLAAAAPLAERLRRMAGLTPAPRAAWLGEAVQHFAGACLRAGSSRPDEPGAAAELLFRALVDPLDRGLVLLDRQGSVIARNSRAAAIAPPGGDLVFADGSPCPPDAHPLALAASTGESQNAVVGRVEDGEIRWLSIDARVLRSSDGAPPYGVAGVLEDVSAEKGWELERLRPPGQLAAAAAIPLDIARVLDEIPPHLFPEQFVSEARRISGGPVAMYVLDIDGTHLIRLAGPEEFPERLTAPLALGPELAEDGIPALRVRLEGELPGVSVAPMWLRGRAIGLLLALRTPEEPLVELGRHGAAAMELAGGYSDVFDIARRRKQTHAAAELQQSLLPPRIARLGGGEIAGSVLPTYEVGGDWFDYVENRDGAWIAIADAVGKGATAGALGGIALAALRAARRDEQSLEATARLMHEVVYDVGRPEFYVTAIVARWHAVYSTISWVNCGHPPPLVARPDGSLEQLFTEPGLPLGLMERERRFVPRQRRLGQDERLILHSDGITARRTGDGLFGLDGIERALRGAESRSAPAMAQAIQEAVLRASENTLQDDAVAIVLAPS